MNGDTKNYGICSDFCKMEVIKEAFPVPTQANPNAVFTKTDIIEIPQRGNEDLLSLSSIRRDLALGRNENKQKVAEDFKRTSDLEGVKRKWKATEAAALKEEKQKELEFLGFPEKYSYLLETAQFAMKNFRAEETKIPELKDEDAKTL